MLTSCCRARQGPDLLCGVSTWRQPSALPLPWAQRWTPVPGRWHRSCHGSELLPGPVRSSEPGGGSPVLAGSWAVASPLQLSGRELGSCFTDFSGDLCCRAGRAPGTCGAAAPVTRRGRRCPGRRWLRDTKLSALQALPCTLFHTLAVGAARPRVAQPSWAERGPCGLRVTATGHRPLGAPSLLRGWLPVQGGQGLPYCCAGFVTARLMPVIGSFYHLNVSPQLLKPASARIYYLADKYKCRFILCPCSSERNENVSKIVKIK